MLCHLLCARRGFHGIRIVAVTGCRELIIWQRVTSCVCRQIRIVKQICISVLSTIISYRLGICVGGISLYADRVEETCSVCVVIYITGAMLWYFNLSGYDETPMCHDMYVYLRFMTTNYLIVMVQMLLWFMVKRSDVNVVHSNHVCHMNL